MRESNAVKAIDLEKLRTELCICSTEEAEEVVRDIKFKFREVEQMMDKQLEVNLRWD